mgnify:CR=1 FL=1|tara:strand:- start:1100 stop:2374 length:1275 start_codon:yes stop_codon:yes gene_type:complete
MSDWEDMCDSMGWANDEHAFDNLIDHITPTPTPKARKIRIDEETYKDQLIFAFENDRNLITENHLFTTSKEAWKSAKDIATKTQSTIKVLKVYDRSSNPEIYIIYEPEMKEAVRLVMENEDRYRYYPEHPLIKKREVDMVYQENRGKWGFVAHPDGTSGSVRDTLYLDGMTGWPGATLWNSRRKIRDIENVIIEKLSIAGPVYNQRNEILNKALVQSQAQQMNVYVIRNECKNLDGELWAPEYITFTEKQLKKFIFTHYDLNLSDSNLTSLPKEIGQLTQLKFLNLNGNNFTSLPKEIEQLTQLKWLELSGNNFTSLPKEIGQLTQLEELDLSENNLTSLPKEIGQFTQLKKLKLSGNNLVSLPKEIGQLTQLEWLDLNDCNITSLPKEIGQLTQLESLFLSGHSLTAIPKELSQFTKLQIINF